MRLYLIFFVLIANTALYSQSFILNQFFQPSLTMNGEFTIDNTKNADSWTLGRINANLIIPVKSKLDVKLNLMDIFNIKSLSDVKDFAKVKAYQIFWTFRPQVSAVRYRPLFPKQSPFADSINLAYGVQTGVTGLHLLSKLRILFYSVNVGVQEEIRTIPKLRPYGNALFGVVNFDRILFYWYYGIAVGASEGQRWPVMAVPFIGVDLHLAKKFWWNITLPVQTRFEWKPSRFVKLDAVAGLGSYSWGFGSPDNIGDYSRHYLSGYQFRTGLAINLKTKRGTKFYLEGGYMPFRGFRFDAGRTNRPFDNPIDLKPAPYFAFSIYYGFKKSLLGSTVENFLNF